MFCIAALLLVHPTLAGRDRCKRHNFDGLEPDYLDQQNPDDQVPQEEEVAVTAWEESNGQGRFTGIIVQNVSEHDQFHSTKITTNPSLGNLLQKSGNINNGDDHPDAEAMTLQKISLPTCWITLAFFLLSVSLVYLLNSRSPAIRNNTFMTLSTVIAIFCAIVLEVGAHDFLHALTHSKGLQIAGMSVITVILYFCLTISCKYFCTSPINTFIFVEGILTHLVAFCCISVFTDLRLQHEQTVVDSFGFQGYVAALICGVPLALLLFHLVHISMAWLRRTCFSRDHEREHENSQSWVELAEECESDSSAIVFGWALHIALRGIVWPYEYIVNDWATHPCSGTTTERAIHGGVVLVLGLLIVLDFGNYANRYKEFMTYAFAFSSMHQTRLQVYSFKKKLKRFASVTAAQEQKVFQTPMWLKVENFMFYWPAFLVIAAVLMKMQRRGWLPQKGLKRLMKAFALASAVLWELMFAEVLAEVSNYNYIHKLVNSQSWSERTKETVYEMITILADMAFMLAVIPAWYYYIAPVAMAADREDSKEDGTPADAEDKAPELEPSPDGPKYQENENKTSEQS